MKKCVSCLLLASREKGFYFIDEQGKKKFFCRKKCFNKKIKTLSK